MFLVRGAETNRLRYRAEQVAAPSLDLADNWRVTAWVLDKA